MSPIDDELRRTLNQRASLLAPPADPLAGIEARARGIRRRRAMASVAGAALAVAAVAATVPLLTDGRPTGAPDQYATATSTPSATANGALDPDSPWAFRGTPIAAGTVDAFTREWQVAHPGGTFTPLWAQIYEPNQQVEVVFLGSAGDRHYVGWGSGSESGPEFRQVAEYEAELGFLQFTAPGDEGVTRLYVVAAPGADLSYATDGVTYAAMTPVAPSVGVVALEGDTSKATVKVVLDGWTYETPARDRGVARPDGDRPKPANEVDWLDRGDASAGPSVADLKVAFTRANDVSDGREVFYRTLFTGDTDSGVRFTVGQAWFEGDGQATTVSYATGTTKGAVLREYGLTPEDPKVLAAVITDLPGTTVDLLVVVPVPGTGQVSYSSEPTGSFRPVTDQDHLDGVVLVDRAKGETDDRIEVLDGNGDLDKPLYRGPLATILAGVPVH